jgi:hypothetical protein
LGNLPLWGGAGVISLAMRMFMYHAMFEIPLMPEREKVFYNRKTGIG